MRGGKRDGAGKHRIMPDKPALKNWTVRVIEEEKQPIRELLKSLRTELK